MSGGNVSGGTDANSNIDSSNALGGTDVISKIESSLMHQTLSAEVNAAISPLFNNSHKGSTQHDPTNGRFIDDHGHKMFQPGKWDGDHFVPGVNIKDGDKDTFVPGVVQVDQQGHQHFVPGISRTDSHGHEKFVPGVYSTGMQPETAENKSTATKNSSRGNRLSIL
jgi:hypothetical protein